jgi:hypothetical protein
MTAAMLRIVRYAMLVFVLAFGAFAYYQSTHRVPLEGDDGTGPNVALLRWVGIGLCAAVVIGIALIRRMREQTDDAKRITLALVGSALAEGAALFGAVIMVLGGDVIVWVLGVVLLIATFSMLPADPEAS